MNDREKEALHTWDISGFKCYKTCSRNHEISQDYSLNTTYSSRLPPEPPYVT